MWFISENYFYCVTALAMPPKADYWKYFNVVGVVAYCLIAECKQPNVSLGAIKLDVQVFDCTSNVHSSGAALLCCWTDIGRKEKQAGPILGWSHPLPTRSFLAGNVQAWMGVKCTPLVLVLHVIVHNLHLNKWCDQLLSIRRSWSLKNTTMAFWYMYGLDLVSNKDVFFGKSLNGLDPPVPFWKLHCAFRKYT